MSIISRKFAASPVRTAAATWLAIIDIIAADSRPAKAQLQSITGVAASIISDETTSNNPITIIGTGPRLRIYCLYNEEAIGDGANETSLSWKPFESDWEIYFPVDEEEYAWVTKLLKEKGPCFKTYKPGDKIGEEEGGTNSNPTATSPQLTINLDKLK